MRPPTDPLHINPEVIDQIQFTQVRNRVRGQHGYEEGEVDEFLDLVTERVAQLMRDNDRLRHENAGLVAENAMAGEKLDGVRKLARSKGKTTIIRREIFDALGEVETP